MTAHDVPVARSWAVIDRPYNSDASRFMISPTRLFCRVRSGDLNFKYKSIPGEFMRPLTALLCCLILILTFSLKTGASQNAGPQALFEGARLITGDGSAPIENSAFIVENDRFTSVGRKGELRAPAGAARI